MAKKHKNPVMAALIKAYEESEIKVKPQGEKESDADYLARFVRAGDKISDAAWKSLSDDVQTWYNSAVDLLDAKKPISLPGEEPASDESDEDEKPAKKGKGKEKEAPESDDDDDAGDDDADDDDDADADDDAGDDEEPAKKGKGKEKKEDADDDDDEKPAKKEKKDKEPKEPKKRKGHGVVQVTEALTIAHPDWPFEKVAEAVNKKCPGASQGTIRIQRSVVLRVMRTLDEAGRLRPIKK